MTEEIATADAEAGKISVDKTNISVTDFAQKRIGDLTPGTEQPQEQEAEEVIELLKSELVILLLGLNSPKSRKPKKLLSRKLKRLLKNR